MQLAQTCLFLTHIKQVILLSNDRMETLTGLVCFTGYNISVSARTSVPEFGPRAFIGDLIRTLNYSKDVCVCVCAHHNHNTQGPHASLNPTAANAPQGLTDTNIGNTTIYLSWAEPTMPCGVITSYRVSSGTQLKVYKMEYLCGHGT